MGCGPQSAGHNVRWALRRLTVSENRMGQVRYTDFQTLPCHTGSKEPARLDRDFQAERPNQKWLADFTCIWTAEGWLYVAAVLDLYSRRVVGWSMKADRDASLVMDALMMAVWRRGKADALLHHSDQGSQFTSTDFIKVLAAREIKISMDGKGAWRDNVFVERLWRTIKYEEVYLRAYASVSEARAGIGRYLTFYNGRRPHSSLDGKTPDQAYFNQPMPEAVAA
jgi:putative transposase